MGLLLAEEKEDKNVKEPQREKLDISRKEAEISRRINNLQSEIDRLSAKRKIVVSEHAILRYMERVMGIPINKVTEELEQKFQNSSLRNFRSKSEGITYVVKDGVLVTIE